MRGVAIGNPKIGRGIEGRRAWRDQLAGLDDRGDAFAIHIHAASVGEFEQAKPLIEMLRAGGGRYRITASFFSPSGYEQQSGYHGIDAACYLPFDTPGQIAPFLDRISPDLIIIIRYDLWPVFLHQATLRAVPVVLVCGVMRLGSARFRPGLRRAFGGLYGMLTAIFAVGEDDRRAFALLAPGVPAEAAGDTRYDRVVERARAAADVVAFTPELIAGRLVLVAGSTWPPDERGLAALAGREDLLLVLVPHEPTEAHVAALRASYPRSVTLAQIERGDAVGDASTIIVDRTGILSALYRVGDLAYVGGGFGEGVHSVLEPAAYGMPVVSGGRIGRSRDAEEMARRGALLPVGSPEEIAGAIAALLDDRSERERLGRLAAAFVEEHCGATARILGELRRRGLLPSGEG